MFNCKHITDAELCKRIAQIDSQIYSLLRKPHREELWWVQMVERLQGIRVVLVKEQSTRQFIALGGYINNENV